MQDPRYADCPVMRPGPRATVLHAGSVSDVIEPRQFYPKRLHRKMGRFEPIHDAHAIEQVALVAQTSRNLEDAELTAVAQAAEQFKTELPNVMQLQTVAFGFGSFPTVPRLPSPFGGVVLNKPRANGTIESELRLDRAAITFRTTNYTRWPEVWKQARRYFETLLPIYAPTGEIGAIVLNYVDKFYWNGEVAEMRPTELLRPGSPYVCPHVFGATDLWHSHLGAFHRADDTVKRLLNINLDCVDESQPATRRVVSITTVLTDMLGQPGYAALRVSDAGVGFFCNRAEELHAVSKVIIGDILNDHACRRIGLLD